jgi:hypothetical protein
MVAQAYPFVARKVLRNDSTNTGELLRDMLYDSEGNIRTSRLGAMLQAALGYVADESEGFVDFDAVPEQGASVQEVSGDSAGHAAVGLPSCTQHLMWATPSNAKCSSWWHAVRMVAGRVRRCGYM